MLCFCETCLCDTKYLFFRQTHEGVVLIGYSNSNKIDTLLELQVL